MSKVYITEFSRGGRDDSDHNMQSVLVSTVPPITQVITKTGSSVACTNAFANSTTIIRVSTDAAVNFTLGPTPVATVNDAYLPADSVEYFSILPGTSLKIAII